MWMIIFLLIFSSNAYANDAQDGANKAGDSFAMFQYDQTIKSGFEQTSRAMDSATSKINNSIRDASLEAQRNALTARQDAERNAVWEARQPTHEDMKVMAEENTKEVFRKIDRARDAALANCVKGDYACTEAAQEEWRKGARPLTAESNTKYLKTKLNTDLMICDHSDGDPGKVSDGETSCRDKAHEVSDKELEYSAKSDKLSAETDALFYETCHGEPNCKTAMNAQWKPFEWEYEDCEGDHDCMYRVSEKYLEEIKRFAQLEQAAKKPVALNPGRKQLAEKVELLEFASANKTLSSKSVFDAQDKEFGAVPVNET